MSLINLKIKYRLLVACLQVLLSQLVEHPTLKLDLAIVQILWDDSDSLRLTLVKQILNLACCRRSIQKTECDSGRHNNSGWVKNRGRLGPCYVTRPKPPLFFKKRGFGSKAFLVFFCVLPLLSLRLLKHSENRD